MAVEHPENVEMAVDITPDKDGGVTKEVSSIERFQLGGSADILGCLFQRQTSQSFLPDFTCLRLESH